MSLQRISKNIKEYKKKIVDARKAISFLRTAPNSGELYTALKDAGFKYDDYGLRVGDASVDQEFGKIDKMLQTLNNEISKVRG